MTEALASRVAGFKLGGIVGVLLIPMLVLSFLMVNSLRQEMALAQRELLGAELNRLVMPVAIGAATGKPDEEAIAAFRAKGRDIAIALGIKPRFDTALATLVTYSGDQRFAVDALAQLQIDSANASQIILDPVEESYHLGTVLSRHAPSLLADFVRMWSLSSRSLRDGQLTREETVGLLTAAGTWIESQNRLRSGFLAAAAASPNPKTYEAALAVADEMRIHPDKIVRLFSKTPETDLAAKLANASELASAAGHSIDDIAELWNFSARGFDQLLYSRYSAMQWQLYSLLAVAAAACLIGVGGAALMFRSTLRQLDEVKLSRDAGEVARAAAEEAAEEVRRVNEDVVRLNADLARNLTMLREAQDESLRKGKMAQLGQLTATVAHELRNPLGAVRTSAFLLARKVKDKGLGVEPQIERINNGITRCDNIISQLLDFARSKGIQPELIGFDDWLTKLVEEEAQRFPSAVAIECRLGLDNALVPFDPARMSRALINLLNNASEALVGKGDDPSKFTARNPLIVVASARTARGVEVTVSDNGPGISPEHIEKIFEPLFTTKNFGTGLGLSAVEKIMEQHGGGIEARSTPGQGARFTIWWPAAQPESKAA